MAEFNIDELISGDRRLLAKAITLVESKLEKHRQQTQLFLEKIMPYTGNSIRVGITGSPGVGKSTFIDVLGLYLLDQGKKVAVLTIDPSSPLSGGSILGDKTRMKMLSQQKNAYIRPSPSGGTLGGVAQMTYETMLFCEAAGYNVVLIETVGVGQSEYELASMVDFFMVLLLPNAGDELQGIKKGIMELADTIIVNKADGDSINMAQQTGRHYQNALNLMSHKAFWTPRVLSCSALENKNIPEVWKLIQEYKNKAGQANEFDKKRVQQNSARMWALLNDMFRQKIMADPKLRTWLSELEQEVSQGFITPYTAAGKIIARLL